MLKRARIDLNFRIQSIATVRRMLSLRAVFRALTQLSR